MRKYFLVISVALLFFSCKKENISAPIAKFSFGSDTSKVISIATYDAYTLINQSGNGNSYQWDLGNGTIASNKDTVIYYSKSGTYNISLTVKDQHGTTSTSTKTIKVFDRVLKTITINSLNWNTGYNKRQWHYPQFNKASVWVEVKKANSGVVYPMQNQGDYNAPVVFTSDVRLNVDSTMAPLKFTVPDKVVLDYPTMSQSFGYKGIGYGFNIYAKDNTGTYLLFSSFWSGTGLLNQNDFTNNKFISTTGLIGYALQLEGDFEQ